MLNKLLGYMTDKECYHVRRRLRYAVVQFGKHGFTRNIERGGWSRHTERVRQLCSQYFFANDEVWERDQDGHKVEKKGQPTEVINQIFIFNFKIFSKTFA